MKTVLFLLLFLVLATPAVAGPPFRTDDPVPIGYRHGEIYLFSAGTHGAGGTGGVGPAVEFNYGILPDTMIHFVLPMAYDAPKGESTQFGYGDTEVGLKYRLLHETDTVPMVGGVPLVEIPTGDADKGLGNGKAQWFLPIWLQKDVGKWTRYGGGGSWINPGSGNRNYWFSGLLLQCNFSESFYLGGSSITRPPTGQAEKGDPASTWEAAFRLAAASSSSFPPAADSRTPTATVSPFTWPSITPFDA
jgi:hypothetical protein